MTDDILHSDGLGLEWNNYCIDLWFEFRFQEDSHEMLHLVEYRCAYMDIYPKDRAIHSVVTLSGAAADDTWDLVQQHWEYAAQRFGDVEDTAMDYAWMEYRRRRQ